MTRAERLRAENAVTRAEIAERTRRMNDPFDPLYTPEANIPNQNISLVTRDAPQDGVIYKRRDEARVAATDDEPPFSEEELESAVSLRALLQYLQASADGIGDAVQSQIDALLDYIAELEARIEELQAERLDDGE